MKRAMNVGHLALNLALHMGCSPLLLAGFDFAFPRGGGATHAASAALSRAIEPMREDGTVVIGGKEGKAAAESGKMTLVPGYYGDEVPTTVPFSLYIKALEKTVAECGWKSSTRPRRRALKKAVRRAVAGGNAKIPRDSRGS